MEVILKLPTAVVIGVGASKGIGGAVCKKFAKEGYHVIIAGRTREKIEKITFDLKSKGLSSESFCIDTTNEDDIIKLFDLAMLENSNRQPADLIVYNAGNNKIIDFRKLTSDEFESFWRIGCYGGFLVGREAARRLVPLGRGTIIFTGATGSLRGKPGFAHFASAKAGLRMISQSMAREFGPLGIHVAHVLIDGGVNGDRLKSSRPDMVKKLGETGLLNVESIASNYWHIHKQESTAWTQEIDLRPSIEIY